MAPASLEQIVLIGYRGCGKTSVGRALAARIGYDFVDTDECVQDRAGSTIAEIFAERGEQGFRDLEVAEVAAALACRRTVISVGGGAVERDENRLRLASTFVVWLTADPMTIQHRIEHDRASQAQRPSLLGLDPSAEIAVKLAQRTPLYRGLATITVDTTAATIGELVDTIATHWQSARRERREG